MTSVVITPPDQLRGIYRDNRIWAAQYVAHRSNDRAIVQLADSTPQAVLQATSRAAKLAGTDGQIIYAVGHGGAGTSSVAGQADFAPNRAFRVTQFLAFYDDKTQAWNGPSIQQMESELREAHALRRRGAPPPCRTCLVWKIY